MEVSPSPKEIGHIFTLNGISDSARYTTDRMADALSAKGYSVTKLRYPLATVRSSRNRVRQFEDAMMCIDQVTQEAPSGDRHIIAHSHGCLINSRIMELTGSYFFKTVTHYAPAQDRKWCWPLEAFDELHIVFNPNDKAVRKAGWLPGWHPWGTQGSQGWIPTTPPGRDVRVTQHEDKARCRPRSHSHYFKGPFLMQWRNWQQAILAAWWKTHRKPRE